MKPIVKLIPKKSMMVLLLPQLLIVGCSKPKHMSEEDLISMRDTNGQGERMYHPETYKPYNGKVEQYYYDSKQKESEGSYKQGKRDSLWTFYYEDGKKKAEVTYKYGMKWGPCTEYYGTTNNTTWDEVPDMEMDMNLRTLVYKRPKDAPDPPGYDKPDWKKSEGNYIRDLKDGFHTEYYFRGEKKSEKTYKDGKVKEVHNEWYVDGQKKWEITYKDGNRIKTWFYSTGGKSQENVYNKDGKLISSDSWDLSETATQREYDKEGGRLIREVEAYTGTIREYDKDGKLIREIKK